jgi:light-independent protochlorophyllide reductase subunit B
MGLEEHLLTMFRDDFEFAEGAAPSHLASTHAATPRITHAAPLAAASVTASSGSPISGSPISGSPVSGSPNAATAVTSAPHAAIVAATPASGAVASAPPSNTPLAATAAVVWSDEAERELKKIPFFVRGKARRNTEAFARERGFAHISLETLYVAKAHFASR